MRQMNWLRGVTRLLASRAGNMATSFALLTPILVGTLALGVEYGNGEYVRARDQRVADAAALAGALAYKAQGTTTAMTNAAARTATLNGIPTSAVTAALVTSPAAATRQAVQVTIRETVPLRLTAFAMSWINRSDADNSLTVVTRGTAELVTTVAGCIIAVDGTSTGVEVSGGARISAPTCSVASNAQLRSGNCGATITAAVASYNTTLNVPTNCGGAGVLLKADGSALTPSRAAVADPYASNSVTTVSALAAPTLTAPSVPNGGTAITFNYTTSGAGAASTVAASIGCTATFSSPTWNFTCPAGSSKTLGSVSIQGGIRVNFNVGATGALRNLTIAGTLTGQDRLTFGPGNYYVRGNLISGSGGITFNGNTLTVTGYLQPGTSGTNTFTATQYDLGQGMRFTGSGTTTFAAATFNLGAATIACNSGNFSLCVQTSGGVTFEGPSTFNIAGGVRTGGGASVTIGTGTGNRFNIGPSTGSGSTGFAFIGDGGSKTIMGDTTTADNVINMAGTVNLLGGGSCLVMGAATHHDIKGNLWATGALWLQPGQYTVLGSFQLGYSGGGNTTCNGQTVGLRATDVTLVIGADSTFATNTGSDCVDNSVYAAFCIGAGYSSVILRAPSAGSAPGFAVIGPASVNRPAIFKAGASGTSVSGTFYMPAALIKQDGAASIGDTTGGCLELVGKAVNISAGAALASSCVSSGGGGGSVDTVRLVQ